MIVAEPRDLLCFSHLRWGFVFQRPNHLMTRAARVRRTFFFEEPRYDAAPGRPTLEVAAVEPSLHVCTPHVEPGLAGDARVEVQRLLLEELVRERDVRPEVLWFYTPMAAPLARGIEAPLVVYDCMDELSAFAGAPPGLRELEPELFRRADLVFTGGHSLYASKRRRHARVHAFPSSVDAHHFVRARGSLAEPDDQRAIPRPRVGYFGVIDERLDLELIDRTARELPAWHWVLVGPVAKIDPAALPQRANIHWLGQKPYASLPQYLAGWDVAAMPFALNEATAFISPTKTLEYMAAGKPVVSTAIADVVEPYGRAGAVLIADRATFGAAIERAAARDPEEVRRVSDAWVARTSWDGTWREMSDLMERVLREKREASERAPECSTT